MSIYEKISKLLGRESEAEKLYKMLNTVYRYMTEKNGVEPIPMNVFLERKEIIKELSKSNNKQY